MVAPQDEGLTTNKRTDHQQSGQRIDDWIAPGIAAAMPLPWPAAGLPFAEHFVVTVLLDREFQTGPWFSPGTRWVSIACNSGDAIGAAAEHKWS